MPAAEYLASRFMKGTHSDRPAADTVDTWTQYTCTTHDTVYVAAYGPPQAWVSLGLPLAESLSTDETDTSAVLAADGAGGVVFIPVTSVPSGDIVQIGSGAGSIRIPGLEAHPGKDGLGGGGITEEYASSTHGLTWTASDPDTFDSDTTVPNHFFAQNDDATERQAYRAWSPGAGALDVRAHVSLARQAVSGTVSCGLLVADAGNTTRILAQITSAGDSNAFTFQAGSYTQRGTTISGVAGLPAGSISMPVLRITRGASNDWSMWISRDGYQWWLLGTHSLTFTVAQVGYRMANTAATQYSFISDFLRTTA